MHIQKHTIHPEGTRRHSGILGPQLEHHAFYADAALYHRPSGGALTAGISSR